MSVSREYRRANTLDKSSSTLKTIVMQPKKEIKYYASLPLEWTDLTKTLDKDDLDIQPGKDPIERRHHISLHVLLPSRPTPELIHKLEGISCFTLTLEGLGCFENKTNDVLYIQVVVNDQLRALHKLLVDEYKQPWQHPEYKPHVTIAFLKSGKGKKYVAGMKLTKTQVGARSVEFRTHGDGAKAIDTIALRRPDVAICLPPPNIVWPSRARPWESHGWPEQPARPSIPMSLKAKIDTFVQEKQQQPTRGRTPSGSVDDTSDLSVHVQNNELVFKTFIPSKQSQPRAPGPAGRYVAPPLRTTQESVDHKLDQAAKRSQQLSASYLQGSYDPVTREHTVTEGPDPVMDRFMQELQHPPETKPDDEVQQMAEVD